MLLGKRCQEPFSCIQIVRVNEPGLKLSRAVYPVSPLLKALSVSVNVQGSLPFLWLRRICFGRKWNYADHAVFFQHGITRLLRFEQAVAPEGRE